MAIREDAQEIINQALKSCLPDKAVRRALQGKEFGDGKNCHGSNRQGSMANGQMWGRMSW